MMQLLDMARLVTSAVTLAAAATVATGVDEALLPVSGGAFVMGDHDGQYDEKPPRIVTLSAFYIQRTEVSEGAYAACVAAGACRPARGRARGSTFPVTGVTWHDARRYCRWRGWRLPTEAQWERAARGTDQRYFPWGPKDARGGAQRAACGSGCGDHRNLMPVTSLPEGAAPSGALHMAGNVEEWVADWYSEGFYQNGPRVDPVGPRVATYKSVRGGEHSQALAVLRASNRYWADPNTYSDRRGFRCAR